MNCGGMNIEAPERMENLAVTCPETGRREEIGCYVARDGEVLVVLRCTRFDPPEAMTCTTACTRCESPVSIGALQTEPT
jgi:hypothetical protein